MTISEKFLFTAADGLRLPKICGGFLCSPCSFDVSSVCGGESVTFRPTVKIPSGVFSTKTEDRRSQLLSKLQ
jgi:hypothetical protein